MNKIKDINKIENNFRHYDQSQPYWDTIYINKLIESDHPARTINLVIEKLDLQDIYMDYSEEGNPPYHPKMMLKILFYGYYCGKMSCRKLWGAVMYRADFIFLAAGAVPNFRTINSYRLRHLDKVDNLFAQIVFLCVQLGMVDFKYLAIDGEKIQANASFKKNKDVKGLKKEYEKTKRGLKKLLEKEPTEDFPLELKNKRKNKIEDKLSDLERMKKRLERFIKQEEECNNRRDRKDGGKRRREKDLKKVKLNMTDEDAKAMQHKNGSTLPSYNDQSAIDGKYGVACSALTTQRPDNPDDLFPLVDLANSNTKKEFKNVIADCAYGSFEVYKKAEKHRKEKYYIPDEIYKGMKRNHFLKKGYAREFFRKDESGNYICPNGNRMLYKGRHKRLEHEVDIYLGMGCDKCANRSDCTTGKVRSLQIDTRIEYQDRMREKLETDKGREIYMKRQGIVEPVHGDDQKNRKWTQHHLRGLFKATAEFVLVRIGTNLRKIVKYRSKKLLDMV